MTEFNEYLNLFVILSIVAGSLSGCMSPLNASGVQRVTPRGQTWSHVSGISWSPDGIKMALTWTAAKGTGLKEGLPEGYVYILDVEKQEPVILTLTKTNTGEVGSPAWSPKSDQVAFATNGSDWDPVGIWLVNADDTGVPVFLGKGASCAWSPDGERIAIADSVRGYRIYILDTCTGDKQEVFQSSEESQYIVAGEISWSPKGDKLAFTYDSVAFNIPHTSNFYELDLASGESRQLVEGGVYFSPSWSPDGTMIAFSGGESAVEGTLFIMRVDDSSIVQPLDIDGVGSVAWSSDGNKIAFEWKGSVYTIDTAVALAEWSITEE